DLAARGFEVDIVTDQTPAHDPLSYVPAGLSPEDAAELRLDAPDTYVRRARESMARHVDGMVAFLDRGAEVFDYGNSLRAEARLGGSKRAFDYPGFVPAYIRPLFCEGKGPFRWVALSGDGVHAGRLGRDCRLAHPQRAPQHLERRLVGERASWRRRRHRSFDPRRHGRGRRRKRAGGEKARTRADQRSGHWRDAARGCGLRAGDRRGPRARCPHADAGLDGRFGKMARRA